MFEFLKLKTPKQQAEYNKEKIINKNVKNIIKAYDEIISNMIEKGVTYENYKISSLSYKYEVNYFREESTEKALLELRKIYFKSQVDFLITWTGCENGYIGISVKFI